MSEESRYCDIVMKGGITSGIVYPNAAIALSKTYRFKNIGGTSAGAIAAAALAAAALGERRKTLLPETGLSATVGFAGLQAVADQLKKEGFIYSLFHPARGSAAAYDLMVALAKKPGMLGSFCHVAKAAFRLAPLAAIATAVLLTGIAWLFAGWLGALGAALPALICTLLVACIFAAARAARLIRANQLGLCAGLRVPPTGAGKQGLTDWLHEVLQRLSGQEVPLTFQHLWDAPRYPDEPKTKNTIQLAMITTGVSHHEPRTLPFEKSRFWFREDEFRRLFPKSLVDTMVGPNPIKSEEGDYHVLPEGGALPVLVATRMSLSFPILLSAIPLYEPNYRAMSKARIEVAEASPPAGGKLASSTDALATGGEPTEDRPTVLRVCWFSDGGIGSNFPIHLFDAALPRWPTFAINLTYPKTTQPMEKAVFLPTENNQGWQRVYSPFGAKGVLAELSGFLFSIIATMQNWRDLLQSRAPGHRDRIIHVALNANEGGMNLDMPKPVLDAIAKKGTLAGETLAKGFDFNNHWWVRWRNVASATERFLIEFATGAGTPVSSDYVDSHSSAANGQPSPPSYPLKASQRPEAQRRFKEMKAEGDYWADHDPDLTDGAPNPLPVLRITPTF